MSQVRTDYRAACRRALQRQDAGSLDQTWDDDVRSSVTYDPAQSLPTDPEWAGRTVFTDVRERENSTVAPEAVWSVVESIGGKNGWYSAAALWRIRGLMDKALGGYGLDRGRRDPRRIRVNDYLDWWRVESVEEGKSVTLRSEMRTGGVAWLQFTVEAVPSGGTRLRQRAVFFPHGLTGRAYWRAVQPFHALIFPTMAKNILAAAAAH